MRAHWLIQVYDQRHREPVYATEAAGRVQFGRQRQDEKNPNTDNTCPYFTTQQDGFQRIVVAPLYETDIPREHVWLEPLPDGRVRFINAHGTVPVAIDGSGELSPGSSLEISLPATLHIGDRRIHIAQGDATAGSWHSLDEPPRPPGAGTANASLFSTVAAATPAKSLPLLLQVAMDVLHSAAISQDFFDLAVSALVERMGLDAGRVLLRDKAEWKVRAIKTAAHLQGEASPPSRQVLDKILQERKTFWQASPTGLGYSVEGINAFVAAPILNREGEVIGALYGDRVQHDRQASSPGASIGELEAMLVELFATGVATGLARMELEERQTKLLRIERDLKIGRDIQTGFLPEGAPQIAGWAITSYFQPAREVSGDFYDFFKLSDDYLALVIADVCDKGIGAALYMTLLRSLLRAFAQQAMERALFSGAGPSAATTDDAANRRRASLLADLTVVSAVELTNNYVAQTHAKAHMFASLFLGVLNTSTGALTYVNAGHDAPVLLGSTHVKARLLRTGPVVGIWPNIAYEIGNVRIEEGDVLVAYTDGVTEARDRAGQFFTEKRLLSILEDSMGRDNVLDGVVSHLTEHIAGADPSDDVTLLAVRRVKPPSVK